MYDDRDKSFHNDWRMTFARLKARGDQLNDLAQRGVAAADPARQAARADYAALVCKLKTVWKAHYLQPRSQRASSALRD
ncbi:hypothetical protein [Methylocystis sp.]|uniref:hypothetical protein n=1 Tax=Methylocystis sp. TaxID=1911079 RepID=UPI0025FBBC57|nr:hypothetical protein [Methylocystis sp.]